MISPFLKKAVHQEPFQAIWRAMRKRKIWLQHKKVYDFWKPVVEDYHQGKLSTFRFSPKIDFGSDKIIWQYWGQGFDDRNVPEVVRICTESVTTHKGDYRVVRLHDGNILDYLDMPAFVQEKRQNPAFNRTFFSDLLRVCLLCTYGGVWLDATILLTKPLPESLRQLPYFVYQRDGAVSDRKFWEQSYAYYWGWDARFKVRMLNSILFARKEGVLIQALQDLLLHYWEKQNDIIDYFFFQILFEVLTEHTDRYDRCPVVSDTVPHLLQAKINNPDSAIVYADVIAWNDMHKMSYFGAEAMKRFREMVEQLNGKRTV